MKNKLFFLLVFTIIGSTLIWSCRKENYSDDSSYQLEFSIDTVLFDTVFTTIGSATQILKVYNRNPDNIRISQIYMATGQQSPYDMNVDGHSGFEFSDIELLAEDSIYIFIKVTIDPNNLNNPVVVTDSIIFETNGNAQDVDLVACGQDAHFILPDYHNDSLDLHYRIVAAENENIYWEDDKPYVIYGYAVVDSAGSLEIGPGTNLYFHKNSGLWVYKGGAFTVSGEPDSIVTFEGDRLDFDYGENPGQWIGLFINESDHIHHIKNAVIKNAITGIQARRIDISDGTYASNLLLENVEIYNSNYSALFTIAFNVTAGNCVFANSGVYNGFFSAGGFFDFRHCTFANYWPYNARQDPSFILSNHLITLNADGEEIVYIGDLDAYTANCIIYGNIEEELGLAQLEDAGFSYSFESCLFKTEQDLSDPELFANCFTYNDSLFVNYNYNNYRLDTIVNPAINKGNPSILNDSFLDLTLDLDGNSRLEDSAPDLGAYEFIPE